jgi:hypothetical protein
MNAARIQASNHNDVLASAVPAMIDTSTSLG